MGQLTLAAKLWARLAYPVCLVVAFSGVFLALEAGLEPTAIIGVVAVISLLFVWAGEYLQPYTRQWYPTLKDNYAPDTAIFLLNNVVLASPVVQLFVATAAIQFAGGGFQLWPDHWSLYIQIPLALVLAEFGSYWWHRASHELPWLWKFHQLHHSPSRLYWLNATRFHYLDVTILQVCSALPLLILGANETVILFVTLFSTFHGYWQHGNTEQKLGPLNFLLSNAELHRWHHNLDASTSNNNYGSNLILWDLVFGTYLWPERGIGEAGAYSKQQIGIENANFPPAQNPIAQMLYPFKKETD